MKGWCKRIKFYKVMCKYQKTSLPQLLLLLWLLYWDKSRIFQLSYFFQTILKPIKETIMDPKLSQVKHQKKIAFWIQHCPFYNKYLSAFQETSDSKMSLKTGFFEVMFCFIISQFILTNLAFFYLKDTVICLI